jgi:uncharacterized protein (TIGR03067 family)
MPHFPVCLCLFISFLVPQEDPIKSEIAKLQGDWRIVSGTMPDEVMRKATVTFREDRMIMAVDEQRTELRFRLNPHRQPKEIDLAKGERKSLGIYDLQGDQLRLCYEVDGRAARPHRFEVVTGTEVLLVLKRRK